MNGAARHRRPRAGAEPGPDRVLSRQHTWGNLGYGLGGLAAAGVLLVDSDAAVVAAVLADAASYVVGAALVASLPLLAASG